MILVLRVAMISIVSAEQRQSIAEFGTPLSVVDLESNQIYVLIEVEVSTDPQSGDFSACVPGIDAFGGGDTREEATLALAVILGKALGSA